MKNKKFPVSVLFALAAILVLANPQWLPLPEDMITNMIPTSGSLPFTQKKWSATYPQACR